MDWSPDRRLQLWIVLSLSVLVLTTLAAVLASGVVVFLVAMFLWTVAGGEVDPVIGELSTILIISASGVILSVVLWGERNAPDHAIAITGAQRASEAEYPVLLSTVRTIAHQVAVPVPTVYVAPTETPISLTTGFTARTSRLVVSEGLLDALEEPELRAVVAHEIAHVKNHDTAVMTSATQPVAAAERVKELLSGPTAGIEHGVVSRADYTDAILSVGLGLVFPLWLLSRLLTSSFARTREFAADRGAVAITGEPAALASALETIDRSLDERPTTDFRRTSISAFAVVEPDVADSAGDVSSVTRFKRRLFSTHPPTRARIERLEADYEKFH
ncbi:M48 family metallopeptidase [Halorubrum tebenquichense]|uniref:Heat shock protein HtpX n=1 Tax=Halorubrum tebenquichense DSM 14210 TaxID=1227485 RepID=M0DKJ2_9EURY|nr:M48 family metallopeptidase [Halorubrum tebenquichense]ELZ34679.1 heat shock protein HtpX [Halorubrum tebenquichense DSM 14210]